MVYFILERVQKKVKCCICSDSYQETILINKQVVISTTLLHYLCLVNSKAIYQQYYVFAGSRLFVEFIGKNPSCSNVFHCQVQ